MKRSLSLLFSILIIFDVVGQVKRPTTQQKEPTVISLKAEDFKYYFTATSNKFKGTEQPSSVTTNQVSVPFDCELIDIRTMKVLRPWYTYKKDYYGKPILKILPNNDIFFIHEQGRGRAFYILMSSSGKVKYVVPAFDEKANSVRSSLTINQEVTKILYIKKGDLWVAEFDIQTGAISKDRQITQLGTLVSGTVPWNWYHDTVCINDLFINLATNSITESKEVWGRRTIMNDVNAIQIGKNLQKYGPFSRISPNRRWIYLYSSDTKATGSVRQPTDKEGTFFFDCQDFTVKRMGPAFHFSDQGATQTGWGLPFWIGEETFLVAPLDFPEGAPDHGVAANKYQNVFVIDLSKSFDQTTLGQTSVDYTNGNRQRKIEMFTYVEGDQKRIVGDFSWLHYAKLQEFESSPNGKRHLMTHDTFLRTNNGFGKKGVFGSFNSHTLKMESLDFDGYRSEITSNVQALPSVHWLDDDRIIYSVTSNDVGVSKQGTYIQNLQTQSKVKISSYLLDDLGDISTIASLPAIDLAIFNIHGELWKCSNDGLRAEKLLDEEQYLKQIEPVIPKN